MADKKGFDTVGELLAQDDIDKVVDNFNKDISPTTKEVLIIYTDSKDDVDFICTSMTNEHLLWLLEIVKMQLLTNTPDEEINET
jgi:hypothetical protein